MGRTLRRNIKKTQSAPFLTYLIRKWKHAVDEIKETRSAIVVPEPIDIPKYDSATKWADEDEDELPELPPWLLSSTPSTPVKNVWNTISSPVVGSPIKIMKEYTYKNS